MNINTARTIISNLSPGLYAGRDWFGIGRAVVYFTTGYARDTVADFGLSGVYNSGKRINTTVTIADKYIQNVTMEIP